MSIKSAEFDGIDDPRFQERVWDLRSSLVGHGQTHRRKGKPGLGPKVLVLLLLAAVGYFVTENMKLGDALPPVTLKKQAISVALPKAPLDFALLSSARGTSAAASRANTPESHDAELSETSISVKAPSPAAKLGKALSSAVTLAPAVAPATPKHKPETPFE